MNELDEHRVLSIYRRVREGISRVQLDVYVAEHDREVLRLRGEAAKRGGGIQQVAEVVLEEADRGNRTARDLVLVATFGDMRSPLLRGEADAQT